MYGAPLYGPPQGWEGVRWMYGSGMGYGPGLLSPTRHRFTVAWRADDAGDARIDVTAIPAPEGGPDAGRGGSRFPRGISHELAQVQDDPALREVTADELIARLGPLSVPADGRTLDGQLLDLRPWGLGWLADLRGDDGWTLAVAADGVDPQDVELSRARAEQTPRRPGPAE